MSSQIEKVREIVVSVTKKSEIQANDFLEAAGVTSMNIIQILSRIENIFDVEIPGEELNPENLKSIAAISNLIDKIRNEE